MTRDTIRVQDLPEKARMAARKQLGHFEQQAAPRGNRGLPFERRIQAEFSVWEAAGIAHLARMPVPTAPAPRPGDPMRRVATGTAPFDLYGWTMVHWHPNIRAAGMCIGAELKTTYKKRPSLAIAEKSGLRLHQLDALAALAHAGGVARLVWENGNEVGVLYNAAILEAHERFYEGGRGTRSIPWRLFSLVSEIKVEGQAVLGWL